MPEDDASGRADRACDRPRANDLCRRSETPSPQSTRVLLPIARLIAAEMRLRGDLIPAIDEPRWMILLDIFVAMNEGRETPFMSAAHASSAPVSTAQRHLHDMIQAGLIAKGDSSQDQRVRLVSLTQHGQELVQNVLARISVLRAREHR